MPHSGLKGNTIIYDTETTGLNPYGNYDRYGFYPARPFIFALGDVHGNQTLTRWEVDPKTRRVIPNLKDRRDLSEIFEDPNITKVGHNLPFDIRMTRKSNIKFNWKSIHDTQIMAHCLTGGSLNSYALKPLGENTLDISEKDQEDLIKSVHTARAKAKGTNICIATKEYFGDQPYKADYWLGDRKLCDKYALGDIERTLLLFLIFRDNLKEEPGINELYKKEMALSREIYRMEHRGVRVLKKHLNTNLKIYYADYCKKWLKIANRNGGCGLNFNSPKQLANKFFTERGHKSLRKTTTGAPSINAKELLRLSKKDKLAKAVLEFKAGESMNSKFIKNYNKYMVWEGGCWVLHPNFHQVGTSSGRLSCSSPNLQQAAKEDTYKRKADIGLKPREALGPRKGYMWYMPDFDQMEVWVFAFQAKYKFMMDLLLSGKDFHKMTAKQIWGLMNDWIEKIKIYREKGKTVMFLKIYGGGVNAVMEQLDCTRSEAQEVIDTYDDKLPGVKDFIYKITNQVERDGFIINPFGRKSILKSGESYKGVNRLVQGMCADIIKNSMIRIPRMLRKTWEGAYQIVTVHDELIIEAPLKYDCLKIQRDIIREMQRDSSKAGIPVPMPVTMKKTYHRWSNARKVTT